jgi:hypothetical protein
MRPNNRHDRYKRIPMGLDRPNQSHPSNLGIQMLICDIGLKWHRYRPGDLLWEERYFQLLRAVFFVIPAIVWKVA